VAAQQLRLFVPHRPHLSRVLAASSSPGPHALTGSAHERPSCSTSPPFTFKLRPYTRTVSCYADVTGPLLGEVKVREHPNTLLGLAPLTLISDQWPPECGQPPFSCG
jgi:hypothetical protein